MLKISLMLASGIYTIENVQCGTTSTCGCGYIRKEIDLLQLAFFRLFEWQHCLSDRKIDRLINFNLSLHLTGSFLRQCKGFEEMAQLLIKEKMW